MEDTTKVSSETTDLFETKDWIEAALFLTHRLPIRSIRQDRGNVWFSFDNTKLFRAEGIIESYFSGTLTVNVRDFVDSQRHVKDIVHHIDRNKKEKPGIEIKISNPRSRPVSK